MIRIIDEKGRLFGKINVIDFLVILFLFCLFPLFYFGYKVFTKNPIITEERELIQTEINYLFIKVSPEKEKIVSIGDKELDENGQVIGEITSLGRTMPYKYEFDIGGGQTIIKEDPILKQIETKLKLTAEVKGEKIYYKDREIKVNSPIEFKTKKYTLMAIPFKKGELIETEKEFLFIKVSPEKEKIVSIGDKELDENGQVIGEITSLGRTMPYKYEFDIGGGQTIIKEDPILKQIETKLKLTAEVKGEKIYYKDREIKVSSPLEFKTKKFNLLAIPREKEEEGEERKIDLNVTLKDLYEDTLKKISVGDKELENNGDTIAEILSLGKVESSYTSFDLGGGNVVKGEDTAKKQISTRMRLKCRVRGRNQLYFKDKKIAHNTPFEFKTDKYTIIGITAEDYHAHRKEKWVSLRVKFSRLVPEIANVIRKGDTGKDAFGKTIARISSIISDESTLVSTVDAEEDKFLTLKHPFDRDITASIEVLCTEKEGDYYFKDNLAKIGSNITFTTDLYTITGLIVGKGVK